MILYVVFVLMSCNLLMVCLFSMYNVSFSILYLFSRKKQIDETIEKGPIKLRKFAILVPAHNEELLIEKTIDSVLNLEYAKNRLELIVIADNCTDQTVKIVSNKGIRCLVRTDRQRRGKPYALNWALTKLNLDEYDAFVILDADTIVHKDFLSNMNFKLNTGAEAIQGYFDLMNPNDTWFTRISSIPGVLKFRLRYYCKERLGLSCPLMGNGMCFSRNIIETYGWNAFSITENWEYYVQLVLGGYKVNYSQDAIIYSHAVTALSHGVTQRKRWLKGQLGVLSDYFKPLASHAFLRHNIIAGDALMELLLPSYSMLLSWTLALFAILHVIAPIQNGFLILRNLTGILLFLQIGYCVQALAILRPPFKTWISLIYVPIFLLWKVIVTIKGVVNLKDKSWNKTERRL